MPLRSSRLYYHLRKIVSHHTLRVWTHSRSSSRRVKDLFLESVQGLQQSTGWNGICGEECVFSFALTLVFCQRLFGDISIDSVPGSILFHWHVYYFTTLGSLSSHSKSASRFVLSLLWPLSTKEILKSCHCSLQINWTEFWLELYFSTDQVKKNPSYEHVLIST